jgi:hypothetical protein
MSDLAEAHSICPDASKSGQMDYEGMLSGRPIDRDDGLLVPLVGDDDDG